MPTAEQNLLRDFPVGTRVRLTSIGNPLRDPDMPGPMLSIDDEGTVTGAKDNSLIVDWDLGISRWIKVADNPFLIGWAVDIITRPPSFTVCVHELEPLADTLLGPRS